MSRSKGTKSSSSPARRVEPSGERAEILGAASQPLNKRDLQKLHTRQVILQSAREVFATRGFEAPSVEDVSRAAGVSRAAFYLHFKSREELLFAVFEREVRWQLRRYRTLTAEMVHSERKFKGWAERFIASFRAERQYILIVYRALSIDPKLLGLIDRERERVVRSLGRRIPEFRLYRKDATMERERAITLHILTTNLEHVSLHSAFQDRSDDLDIALAHLTRDFVAFAKSE
jgi:AcrR family transcriptional regulator